MIAATPTRLLVTHVDPIAKLSLSVKHVTRVAKSLGHDVTVARAEGVRVVGDHLEIAGTRAALPDGVIVRGGADHTPDALRALAELEAAGVRLTNRPSVIELVGDKGAAAEVLHAHGIPHPPAATIRPGSGEEVRAQVLRAIDLLGTDDLVLKPNSGKGGAGVMFLDGTSEVGLRSIVDTVMPRTDGKGFIVQPWLRQSPGRDWRVYVSTHGDELVASKIGLERRAAAGQGAANIANGGSSGYVEIPADMRANALDAARALDVRFGAVDFITGPAGWQVVEVNTSPGVSRSVSRKLGFDQAEPIVAYAAAAASR